MNFISKKAQRTAECNKLLLFYLAKYDMVITITIDYCALIKLLKVIMHRRHLKTLNENGFLCEIL